MSEPDISPHAFRVADLRQNRETGFELRPTSAEMAEIAAELGLTGLRKLSFRGQISALGKSDWQLDAQLGATVTQPCVVTLEPVVTRLDEPVLRRFVKELPDVNAGSEVELPDDDTLEPLTSHIDPWQVMCEALALHLPLYPRAEGAELGEAVFTESGLTPMREQDTKPFAGLAALQEKLNKES